MRSSTVAYRPCVMRRSRIRAYSCLRWCRSASTTVGVGVGVGVGGGGVLVLAVGVGVGVLVGVVAVGFEELRSIRTRGWATSYQETNLGLWGIAITLLDSDTNAVAAVGLAGPRDRLPKSRIPEVLNVLDEGARAIAATRALKTSTQLSGEWSENSLKES